MLIILHCMQHTQINPRLYEFSKTRSQTACMFVKQQSNWLFYDKIVHILTTNAPEMLIRRCITHLYVLYRLSLSLAASRTEVLRSATDFTGGFAPLAPPPGAPPLDPVLWFMQLYACILDVVAIFRTLKGQPRLR